MSHTMNPLLMKSSLQKDTNSSEKSEADSEPTQDSDDTRADRHTEAFLDMAVDEDSVIQEEDVRDTIAFLERHFPQSHALFLHSDQCDTECMPFSIGRIQDVSTDKGTKSKVTHFASKYSDNIIQWIYSTYTGKNLKHFPKIKTGNFDPLINLFK